MRVGIFTPNYPGVNSEGGIGSYTRNLARGLAVRGHDVLVMTPGESATHTDKAVTVNSIPLPHIPLVDRLIPGAGACWNLARSVARVGRAAAVDVLEFPNWEGFGVLQAAFGRIPCLVRLHTSSKEAHEIDGARMTRRLRWDVRRERWLATRAITAVTHSQAHRLRMSDEIGLSVERIRLVPHGVETFPRFVRPARSEVPPTVMYLGRLEHRKGTVELLRAIPAVLARVPDTKFVLIGADRPHAPGGRTHAQYLEQEFPSEVRNAVTLAGRLPDDEVDRRLQSADLFIAPSRYESFGLIFLEAMRWGTPVVGTTAGGIPEIVEHGKSGWLVPPESPHKLADAIVHLLLHPELRAALGEAGRRRAETEFSVETMVGRMEDLYSETIARRKRRW